MKRTILVIALVLCASAQAFVGTMEATVRSQYGEGPEQVYRVKVYTDGTRWRQETTWLGKTNTDKGLLPSYWVTTVDDNGYSYYAPEFASMVVHGGERFTLSKPTAVLLYEDGEQQVRHTTEGVDVTVTYTQVSTEKPDVSSFAIRPPLGTRIKYPDAEVNEVVGQTATFDQPSPEKLDGWECSEVVQYPSTIECEYNGYCEGLFGYLYLVYICAEGYGSCYSDYVPSLSETACRWSYYLNECEYRGDWVTYFQPGCYR